MKHRIQGSRVGRPPLFNERMNRVNVMLTDDDLERARRIGRGNVSAALRFALGWAYQRGPRTDGQGGLKMKAKKKGSEIAKKSWRTTHRRRGAREAVLQRRINWLYNALKSILDTPKDQDGNIILPTTADGGKDNSLYLKARNSLAKAGKK